MTAGRVRRGAALSHPPRVAPRRGPLPVWGLLLLTLLLAQSLGQWHRVQHGPHLLLAHGPLPAHAVAQAAAQAVGHAEPAAALADAWGHDGHDAAQCQLYDHLASADSSWPAWPGLAVAPDAPRRATWPGAPVRHGCRALPWQARAPPAAGGA